MRNGDSPLEYARKQLAEMKSVEASPRMDGQAVLEKYNAQIQEALSKVPGADLNALYHKGTPGDARNPNPMTPDEGRKKYKEDYEQARVNLAESFRGLAEKFKNHLTKEDREIAHYVYPEADGPVGRVQRSYGGGSPIRTYTNGTHNLIQSLLGEAGKSGLENPDERALYPGKTLPEAKTAYIKDLAEANHIEAFHTKGAYFYLGRTPEDIRTETHELLHQAAKLSGNKELDFTKLYPNEPGITNAEAQKKFDESIAERKQVYVGHVKNTYARMKEGRGYVSMASIRHDDSDIRSDLKRADANFTVIHPGMTPEQAEAKYLKEDLHPALLKEATAIRNERNPFDLAHDRVNIMYALKELGFNEKQIANGDNPLGFKEATFVKERQSELAAKDIGEGLRKSMTQEQIDSSHLPSNKPSNSRPTSRYNSKAGL